MSLKNKLTLLLLSMVIVPLAINSIYSYSRSSAALKDDAFQKLQAVSAIKSASVKQYFNGVQNQIQTFGSNLQVVQAMQAFNSGFWSYERELRVSAVDRIGFDAKTKAYYTDSFSSEYKKQNGIEPELSAIWSKLQPETRTLQYAYIAANPNPLGSKHLMDRSPADTQYNRAHATHHPIFRRYLEKFGLYDIFLVDIQTGQVVYTVYKELDFGTNLRTGPYADTSLAEVVKKAALATDKDAVFLSDYKPYFPSYAAPASFIAVPIYSGDRKIGVAAFQMPIDRLTAVMSERAGMGQTGESFLVGADFLLRSDTVLGKDVFNVVNSFRNPGKATVKNHLVDSALRGEALVDIAENYRGKVSFQASFPFSVLGLNWALLSNIEYQEAAAPLNSVRNAMLIIAAVTLLLAVLVSFYFSRNLASSIEGIAADLQKNAELVAKSSTDMSRASSELSEAATEQASSLQETVSSINEISSMVKRNAEAAESSTQVAKQSRTAAGAGKETVEVMIRSIGEVASSNELLTEQVMEGNQRISEIVSVISQIGEKTRVINDIVFQTKLLSFNASVEAARAGEHGKGFAVVAEEVGNLATMSGDAAKEITEMLGNSIKKVTDIVSETKERIGRTVETGKEKIEHSTKTARACGEALEQILKHTSSVSDLVSEISLASKEQAQGVEEVNKAMTQLDQVTQQNTSVAQDSAQMSAKLSQQATSLRNVVHRLEGLVRGEVLSASPAVDLVAGAKVIPIHSTKAKSSTTPNNDSIKMAASGAVVPNQSDARFEEV